MALKDAPRPGSQDSRGIATELHSNWSRPSSQGLKRILVDAEGANKLLLDVAGDFVGRREVYRVLGAAPYLPAAGTSSVSLSNRGVQVDLVFPYDILALHVMAL